MRSLRRFLRLSAEDQVLLIWTAALLGAARVGLWVLPFQIVRRALVGRGARARRHALPDVAPLDRVLWAVRVAGRRVPGSTCFTRALVAESLLRRAGHDALLRIGVARDRAGDLSAHAWVEAKGTVVLGECRRDDPRQFVPMPAF